MISAGVKANKNNKKKKIWWLYFTISCKEYFQNMKYNVKGTCIFQFILVGVLPILILSVKNRGGWFFFA